MSKDAVVNAALYGTAIAFALASGLLWLDSAHVSIMPQVGQTPFVHAAATFKERRPAPGCEFPHAPEFRPVVWYACQSAVFYRHWRTNPSWHGLRHPTYRFRTGSST
jgi:hypothetical protein